MNKSQLKFNTKLSKNVSSLIGKAAGKRCLVLDKFIDLSGMFNGYKLNDYFDLIIVEDMAFANSISNPDIVFYRDELPYTESVFVMDKLEQYPNTLFCTNYEVMSKLKKMNKVLNFYNLNYLTSNESVCKLAGNVKGSVCGLNPESLGVHIALILGCSKIYYTGTSGIDYNFLVEFTEKKVSIMPSNLIKPNRETFLNLSF